MREKRKRRLLSDSAKECGSDLRSKRGEQSLCCRSNQSGAFGDKQQLAKLELELMRVSSELLLDGT